MKATSPPRDFCADLEQRRAEIAIEAAPIQQRETPATIACRISTLLAMSGAARGYNLVRNVPNTSRVWLAAG